MYNMTEFLTTLKEDIGIGDIPLPVSDSDLVDRIKRSALAEFSQRYPRHIEFMLSDSDRISGEPNETRSENGLYVDKYGEFRCTYKIPEQYYMGATVMGITNVYTGRPNNMADAFVPQGYYVDPLSMIMSLADIKYTATFGSSVARSMTFEFAKPNLLYLYNGWSGGVYTVRARISHSISLATIPDTAMTNFRELCQYDLESYLYGKLKRKNTIDTGVGTIDLKIDDWSGSGDKFRDLLNRWDDEGANLDIDDIFYF